MKSISGQALLDAYVSAEKQQESTYKKYREVLGGTAMSLSRGLGSEVTEGGCTKICGFGPDWPAFPDTSRIS